MLGVLVNTGTVLLGSLLGLLLKKGIPEKITKAIMLGIGLCTLYIGWSGTLEGENTLILIISMAIGIGIGEAVDLDRRLNTVVRKVEAKFQKEDQQGNFAQGFITASLLFCVGAMTIVGSLQAGLRGDNEMLFTKSVLDFVSSLIFASTLGIGVLFAAIFVLVFQGGIVLLAQVISPLLSSHCISEMTCVGSLLIFALGLNILGVTKLKVMNFLPAVFMPMILCLFM